MKLGIFEGILLYIQQPVFTGFSHEILLFIDKKMFVCWMLKRSSCINKPVNSGSYLAVQFGWLVLQSPPEGKWNLVY